MGIANSPKTAALWVTGRNLPSEILFAVSRRFRAGASEASHIAIHSLQTGADRWHRRDRCLHLRRSSEKFAHGSGSLRWNAQPDSLLRSRHFGRGIPADAPRRWTWCDELKRSRWNPEARIGCHFKCWPTNCTSAR